MSKSILIFGLVVISFVTNAQNKRTMKRLEKQVQKAKDEAAAYQKSQEVTAIKYPNSTPGAALLPFSVITSNETMFTNADVNKDHSILLVLFNPMCDHCQKVATTIKDSIDRFQQTTILFVCGMNLLNELKNFISLCGIEGLPNFIVAAAKEEFVNQLFHSKGIPQMMVYNKDKILQQVFYETINVDSIAHYLHK